MRLPLSYKAPFEQPETVEKIAPSCSAVTKEALN